MTAPAADDGLRWAQVSSVTPPTVPADPPRGDPPALQWHQHLLELGGRH